MRNLEMIRLTVSIAMLAGCQAREADTLPSPSSNAASVEVVADGATESSERSDTDHPVRDDSPVFTISTVIRVAEELENPRQPQVAVGADGSIFVVIGADSRIYCCTSHDGGGSWSAPVLIGEIERLALGGRRGPRIAVTNEAIVVTAIGHRNGDLLAWRSTDRGDSWDGPTTVNDVPRTAREGLHAMAASAGGHICCTWLDLRNGKTEIYARVSTDHGATWLENVQVYRSPSGTVCECCHPSAAYDAQGHLHVMFRNFVDGYRDMYVSSSTDGGVTFADGFKLGSGGWLLNACPMDGGAVAVASDGEMTTVWRRESEVFRATAIGDEQSLGSGEQPWVVATKHGPFLVWLARRPGELWLAVPGESAPRQLAENASDPVIAATTTGEGPVVAVWESATQGKHSIMAAVVDRE